MNIQIKNPRIPSKLIDAQGTRLQNEWQKLVINKLILTISNIPQVTIISYKSGPRLKRTLHFIN